MPFYSCPLSFSKSRKERELCFSQTFGLEVSSENTGTMPEHPFAPHASRNCLTKHTAVLMAPSRWVSRGSLTEEMLVLWSHCPDGSLSFTEEDADSASHSTRSCYGERICQLGFQLQRTLPH